MFVKMQSPLPVGIQNTRHNAPLPCTSMPLPCASTAPSFCILLRVVSIVQPVQPHLSSSIVLTMSQPGTDGISTASGATRATPFSTPMQTSSCSATAPSYATIALIVVAPAETRLKIWPSSPATRPSAPRVSGAGIASGRSRICDTPGHHRGYSA